MRPTLEAPSQTGVDLKVDPAFEELQAAVRQALSAVGGSSADWEKILQLSTQILDTKAKDLVVAGYRAVALSYLRKVEGFLLGSGAFLELLEKHWGTVSPGLERPKARIRAIEWWLERSVISLRALGTLSYPRESVEALLKRLRSVDELLNKKLVDTPSLGPLIQGLQRLLQTPEPVPDALAVAGPEAQTRSVAAEVATGNDAEVTAERLTREARHLAAYRQSIQSTDVGAYRLNRFAYWFFITDLPPAQDGRTAIAAPDAPLLSRLSDLRSAAQWPALLHFAEETAFQSLFWLDLQRASSEALAAQGPTYQEAAGAVQSDARAFAARLPGVENLTFANGMPFADDETRAWLHAGAEQAVPAVVTHSKTEPAAEQAIAAIKAHLKNRRWAEAAQLFQAGLKAAGSGREQFLYRLAFAGMLSKLRSAWFGPQAEQLVRDIDVYRLDRFDPTLAIQALHVGLTGYRAQGDVVSKKRAEELSQRLAQLDLTEFVRQGGAN